VAASLLFTGCGSDGPPGDAARIDVELVADLSADDARAIGDAMNTFGFDLLDVVATENENTVTSPVSVATLLAMVLAGAEGDTAEAMADGLHLDEPRDVRVGALLRSLADTDDVTLSVANALWADDGMQLEEAYVDFVTDTFGATLEEADLSSQTTADEIDQWVEDRTEGLIEDIAGSLGLPSTTAVLVLINAVYFLGEWTTPFDSGNTLDGPFTLADGSETDVALMRMRYEDFSHATRDGYRMLRMPYGADERYAMEVLLPDEDSNVDALLASLDADEWHSAVDDLTSSMFEEIVLPRFELEWELVLNDALIELGMGAAFGGGSDFRPMSPSGPVLDTVVHKTYIRVDEEGTEAAAVTAADMAGSAPAEPMVFRVDRPFVFTISDAETGTILFLGTVVDPRG
jgi:serpin B